MVKKLFLFILIILLYGCSSSTIEIDYGDNYKTEPDYIMDESRESILLNNYKNQLFILLDTFNENSTLEFEPDYSNKLLLVQENIDFIYYEYKDIIDNNESFMLLDENIYFLINYLIGLNAEHELFLSYDEMELITHILIEINSNINIIESSIEISSQSVHIIGDYHKEYEIFMNNYNE